jgi:DNA-binding NtrC family response regulator
MGHVETRKRERKTGTKVFKTVSKPNAHESKTRLLVVDDAIHVVKVIRDLLEFKGFEVETAQNGDEAIALLRNGGPFDLLITDVRMPEMGGLEVLRWVEKYSPRLPIIIMTGYPTVDDGMKFVQAGVVDYITKPFKFERLYNSAMECLGKTSMKEEEIAQAV